MAINGSFFKFCDDDDNKINMKKYFISFFKDEKNKNIDDKGLVEIIEKLNQLYEYTLDGHNKIINSKIQELNNEHKKIVEQYEKKIQELREKSENSIVKKQDDVIELMKKMSIKEFLIYK